MISKNRWEFALTLRVCIIIIFTHYCTVLVFIITQDSSSLCVTITALSVYFDVLSCFRIIGWIWLQIQSTLSNFCSSFLKLNIRYDDFLNFIIDDIVLNSLLMLFFTWTYKSTILSIYYCYWCWFKFINWFLKLFCYTWSSDLFTKYLNKCI